MDSLRTKFVSSELVDLILASSYCIVTVFSMSASFGLSNPLQGWILKIAGTLGIQVFVCNIAF